MIGPPQIEERSEQPYLGIRTRVSMQELGQTIPQLVDELFPWLAARGVEAVGAPFTRYHIIDMAGKLEIEIGIPVAVAVAGDGRVAAGTLPAGRYASLVYTGVRNGIAGNGALLEWGAAQGPKWDQWHVPQGDAFGSRYETLLTNPDEEPNQAQWETEVAIRLAGS